MKRQYFSLFTTGNTATLNIYGDITSFPIVESDVSSYNLSRRLEELQGVTAIDVYINSYGGEVAEGLAIYNALKRKAQSCKVTTYCDGFACSIASVIFMAGTERKMHKSSLLMIHNAWTFAEGNAAELRKVADDMDVITGASVEAYKGVATISEDEIREMMDAEQWITPQDAVKFGFATDIVDEKTENPSQNVRKSLFDIIMAAKQAENDDEDETEENTEDEDENGENGLANAENEGESEDDEGENADNGENDPENGDNDDENDDNADDTDDKASENTDKAAQKLGGFFNYFM